jgi:bacteriorhodopsin
MSTTIKDMNADGEINEKDVDMTKIANQTKLAWFAAYSIVLVTVVLLSPFVSESRITALSDLLEIYYIAQASVIGMFMGASTYLSVKMNERLDAVSQRLEASQSTAKQAEKCPDDEAG